MKQQELTLISGSVTDAPTVADLWDPSAVNWESHLVYRELADVPVQIVDPLEELQRNLHELEDKQQRLRFMMREIRGMMKV